MMPVCDLNPEEEAFHEEPIHVPGNDGNPQTAYLGKTAYRELMEIYGRMRCHDCPDALQAEVDLGNFMNRLKEKVGLRLESSNGD